MSIYRLGIACFVGPLNILSCDCMPTFIFSSTATSCLKVATLGLKNFFNHACTAWGRPDETMPGWVFRHRATRKTSIWVIRLSTCNSFLCGRWFTRPHYKKHTSYPHTCGLLATSNSLPGRNWIFLTSVFCFFTHKIILVHPVCLGLKWLLCVQPQLYVNLFSNFCRLFSLGGQSHVDTRNCW